MSRHCTGSVGVLGTPVVRLFHATNEDSTVLFVVQLVLEAERGEVGERFADGVKRGCRDVLVDRLLDRIDDLCQDGVAPLVEVERLFAIRLDGGGRIPYLGFRDCLEGLVEPTDEGIDIDLSGKEGLVTGREAAAIVIVDDLEFEVEEGIVHTFLAEEVVVPVTGTPDAVADVGEAVLVVDQRPSVGLIGTCREGGQELAVHGPEHPNEVIVDGFGIVEGAEIAVALAAVDEFVAEDVEKRRVLVEADLNDIAQWSVTGCPVSTVADANLRWRFDTVESDIGEVLCGGGRSRGKKLDDLFFGDLAALVPLLDATLL